MIFPQELQSLIDVLQMKMYQAIKKHHVMFLKFDEDKTNSALETQLKKMQNDISSIGLEQKKLIERLRKETDSLQKNETINGAWVEKENSINDCIVRSRKQNIISRWPSTVSGSASDESLDALSADPIIPEPPPLKKREELTQAEFLLMFGLVTHDVYKEMQTKRAERKRRSTVNPQFLYCARDYPLKRRRNKAYLQANFSPPRTRQSAKNKIKLEKGSPPSTRDNSGASSPIDKKDFLTNLPPIPNLPSGLTIERVNPNRSSPDIKLCLVCRLPGPLSICESCFNGYHVGCHNRPLVQTPRKCPKCIENKEVRTVGSLNVPSGMSVSYVSAEVSEKMQEKQKLLESNKSLTAELTQLQDKHSHLTISLKDQKATQDELLAQQKVTRDKIRNILSFVQAMKAPIPSPAAATAAPLIETSS